MRRDNLELLEAVQRPWRRLRLSLAVWAVLQFTLYKPNDLPFPLPQVPTGLALAAFLMVTNLASVLAWRHCRRRSMLRVNMALLGCDGVTVMTLVWLFAYDHDSSLWTLLLLPLPGAALIGGLRGALTAWALTAVVYVPREFWAEQAYGYPVEVASITYRLGVVLAYALILGSLGDILARLLSNLRRTKDELAHQATHDELTGLPNRRLFTDRLRLGLADARRRDEAVAVLLVDLDRFKQVNDQLGHHVGDALLVAAADRLQGQLREVDTIARLGGDEFAVVLPGIGDQCGAQQVARRLLSALAAPYPIEGIALTAEASIGIALAPEHGSEEGMLLQHADLALYAAKRARNTSVVYAESTGHDAVELNVLADLRQALARGELVLYYQPQADLRTGHVTGAEALLRWEHPTRGLLTPDRFLAAAEQTGLIEPLTRYVLDHAVRQLHEWRAQGLDLTLAVNLSARNLLDVELPDAVADLLRRYDLPPAALELELTESTIVVDAERAEQVLGDLARLGTRIAIDDYGTGYSCLSALRSLPAHTLKVDRSFIGAMTEDPQAAAIVRHTVALGRDLGLRVIAEGVETPQVLARLTALGCDAMQGYLLGRPMPAHDLQAVLDVNLSSFANPVPA